MLTVRLCDTSAVQVLINYNTILLSYRFALQLEKQLLVRKNNSPPSDQSNFLLDKIESAFNDLQRIRLDTIEFVEPCFQSWFD